MYHHIVLVSVDTLRADAIETAPTSLYTRKFGVTARPSTPLLNHLAEQGHYFSHTISAAPYTSSSHASFFSGCWPLRHGLYEFYNRRLSWPTLFTLAKQRGLRTIFKTDFPIILGDRLGFTDDVDDYFVEDDEGVLDAIAEHRPSLAFVHFSGAHLPYGFHNLKFGGSRYRDKIAELGAEIGGFNDLPADQLLETYRDDEDRYHLICYKRAVEFFYDRKEYRRLMQLYLEGVSFFMRSRFDPFMERLLSLLRGTNSLLVVFGDHGEEYDDDSRGHFDSLNEGVIRVPMIFHGRDVVRGQTDSPVRSIDLFPTLVDRLGWRNAAAEIDGKSLADTVFGGSSRPPDEARLAFAQTYVCDASEFLSFQKRVFAGDDTARHLRHMLYKEGAWLGRNRVIRQHHAYAQRELLAGLGPCKMIVSGHRETTPGVYVEDAAVSRLLAPELDRYGRSRGSVEGPRVDLNVVRRQLGEMGYRV
jgi:choline-sulfatase